MWTRWGWVVNGPLNVMTTHESVWQRKHKTLQSKCVWKSLWREKRSARKRFMDVISNNATHKKGHYCLYLCCTKDVVMPNYQQMAVQHPMGQKKWRKAWTYHKENKCRRIDMQKRCKLQNDVNNVWHIQHHWVDYKHKGTMRVVLDFLPRM